MNLDEALGFKKIHETALEVAAAEASKEDLREGLYWRQGWSEREKFQRAKAKKKLESNGGGFS